MSERKERGPGVRWENADAVEQNFFESGDAIESMTPEQLEAYYKSNEQDRLVNVRAAEEQAYRVGTDVDTEVTSTVIAERAPGEAGFIGGAAAVAVAIFGMTVPWVAKRVGYGASGVLKATDQLGLDLIKKGMKKSLPIRWLFTPLNFVTGGLLLGKPEKTWGEKDEEKKKKEEKEKKKKEGKGKLVKDLVAGGLSKKAAEAIADGTAVHDEDKEDDAPKSEDPPVAAAA